MVNGLEILGLTATIGERRLFDMTCHVRPGEVLCVMAPSGAGKSTLLSAIAGTVEPQIAVEGSVILNGADLMARPAHKRRVGLMFQDDLLFPHMSVGQNVGFGLVRGARDRRGVIEDALAQVGLSGFADRDPATLSGGQRARVSLLRTLMAEPQLLLLDEPFSGFDAELRDQIRALVIRFAVERSLPVILVTHDLEDAEAMGGRIVPLSADS